MTVKEIRNELVSGLRVKFTVKGHSDTIFTMVCLETGENRAVSNNIYQMNVSKFGPTCLTLYTYDMMDNKTVGKIKYADVTLVSRVVENGDKNDVVTEY